MKALAVLILTGVLIISGCVLKEGHVPEKGGSSHIPTVIISDLNVESVKLVPLEKSDLLRCGQPNIDSEQIDNLIDTLFSNGVGRLFVSYNYKINWKVAEGDIQRVINYNYNAKWILRSDRGNTEFVKEENIHIPTLDGNKTYPQSGKVLFTSIRM